MLQMPILVHEKRKDLPSELAAYHPSQFDQCISRIPSDQRFRFARLVWIKCWPVTISECTSILQSFLFS
jgi:hypothetical protein